MKGFLRVAATAVFILCAAVFLGANGKCVPGKVPSANFTTDNQLIWPAAANTNNCTIDSYVIYLMDNEGAKQMYETPAQAQNNTFDFSQLDMCTPFVFSVVAKTNDNVIGDGLSGSFTTPPKEDIDLNITIDHTVSTENSSINIVWEMTDGNSTKCVSYYRLVLWNETNEPTDMYLDNANYILANVIPCTTYEFQVRAIIVNPEIEGPFTLVKTASLSSPTTPPELQSVSTTNTTATMVWQLEDYKENKCEIKALVIETVLKPTVTVPITDSSNRSLVTANLTNLTPDTVYSSQVYVMNTAGNSTIVTITYQTAQKITKVSTDSTSLSTLWRKIKDLF